MKIAIVTHCLNHTDGQGRVNFEIANECLRRGHSVLLIASDVDAGLLGLGAEWHRVDPILRCPWLVRAYDFTCRADRFINKHRKSIDCIVANGFTLRRPHDANLSHFVHNAWRDSSGNPFRNGGGARGIYQRSFTRLNCRWELDSYRAANAVVAVSEIVRDDLVRIGLPREQIHVIPNGVNLEEFHPAEKPPTASDRAALGLPEAGILALFVGDLKITRKNLDAVLRAMIQIPDLQVAVVGGTERSSYPALATELGLGDRVHFLGFRSDVAAIMRHSDFYVMPSRYDPFGLVILEAMASGLPVITASTTGASSLVSKDCGFVLSDPEDIEGCTDAMRHLTNNSVLRKSMGDAARVVAQNHSWSQMAAAYCNLFDSVTRKKSFKKAAPPRIKQAPELESILQ